MPTARKGCAHSGLLDVVDDGIDFTADERRAVEIIIKQNRYAAEEYRLQRVHQRGMGEQKPGASGN